MSEIIHIGYGDSAAGSLRQAIDLGMPGDQVVVSRDDFTQGPISDCLQDGGLVQRSEYWSSLKTMHTPIKNVYDHYASFIKRISGIEEKSRVVLWIGDSAHDRLATSWVITYLRDKNIDWHYIDLKAARYRDIPVVFNLAMLTTERVKNEFEKISPISDKSIDKYKEFWFRISKENTQYRIQTEGDVLSVNEMYHDSFILSHINNKDQFLGKLLATIMKKSEHRLTDTTIESRLVVLQSQRKIKIEPNLTRIFLSKVKLL